MANIILVTGGAGFIGSHIAAALVGQGYDVHILDNLSTGKKENVPEGATLHVLDVRDSGSIANLFATHHFPVMFHQAAQMSVRYSVDNPAEDSDVNVRGIINLMEAGRRFGLKKMIFASSGGVIYGDPVQIPQHEEHPLVPESPYGISKLACEKYLRFYHRTYGIPYIALRYGNVYGPRQNPASGAGVIAMFLEKLLTGQEPTINGDGKQTRDYIYVSDIVAANMCALLLKNTGTFNIGTGIETDVVTIFELIRDMCKLDIKATFGPAKAGEQLRSVLNITKAKTVLGWQPRIRFSQGLRRTVEWYIESYKSVMPLIMDHIPEEIQAR